MTEWIIVSVQPPPSTFTSKFMNRMTKLYDDIALELTNKLRENGLTLSEFNNLLVKKKVTIECTAKGNEIPGLNEKFNNISNVQNIRQVLLGNEKLSKSIDNMEIKISAEEVRAAAKAKADAEAKAAEEAKVIAELVAIDADALKLPDNLKPFKMGIVLRKKDFDCIILGTRGRVKVNIQYSFFLSKYTVTSNTVEEISKDNEIPSIEEQQSNGVFYYISALKVPAKIINLRSDEIYFKKPDGAKYKQEIPFKQWTGMDILYDSPLSTRGRSRNSYVSARFSPTEENLFYNGVCFTSTCQNEYTKLNKLAKDKLYVDLNDAAVFSKIEESEIDFAGGKRYNLKRTARKKRKTAKKRKAIRRTTKGPHKRYTRYRRQRI